MLPRLWVSQIFFVLICIFVYFPLSLEMRGFPQSKCRCWLFYSNFASKMEVLFGLEIQTCLHLQKVFFARLWSTALSGNTSALFCLFFFSAFWNNLSNWWSTWIWFSVMWIVIYTTSNDIWNFVLSLFIPFHCSLALPDLVFILASYLAFNVLSFFYKIHVFYRFLWRAWNICLLFLGAALLATCAPTNLLESLGPFLSSHILYS